MLSDWTRIQRSPVGWCEKLEDDVKKYQTNVHPRLTKYYCRFLSCFWTQVFSEEFPSSVLTDPKALHMYRVTSQ